MDLSTSCELIVRLKKPVRDDSYLWWCIILLEAAIRRLYCVHQEMIMVYNNTQGGCGKKKKISHQQHPFTPITTSTGHFWWGCLDCELTFELVANRDGTCHCSCVCSWHNSSVLKPQFLKYQQEKKQCSSRFWHSVWTSESSCLYAWIIGLLLKL